MSRTIRVAITQMDVKPAPTGERLERADRLVSEAEPFAIDLVVLPELFNTGYIFSDENFRHAEPMDGPTIHWMKTTARQLRIYLAGSLLLLEHNEIFNAMLIVSPNGRLWRYDKSYPWAWEHGYFRPTQASGPQRAVVAETDLGLLGMMVCWDVAHTDLWRCYAGRVDLMVICSSPPQFSQSVYSFADGQTFSFEESGPILSSLKNSETSVFTDMLTQQTAWSGIPSACSSASGRFESEVPNGRGSLLAMLPVAPWLIGRLQHANGLKIAANMAPACKIISGQGKLLAHVLPSEGESFTVAEVTLPDKRQPPPGPQPGPTLSRLSYLISDLILPRMVRSIYQKGISQIRSAPSVL